MQAVVRPARAEDAEALALVAQATFLETFAGILDGAHILAHCREQHAPAVYRSWLQRSDVDLWLAETASGRSPIGYAVLDAASSLPVANPSPRDAELKRIYLLSRFQGTGIGADLMQAAFTAAGRRGATRVLLGVYQHNARAVSFYRKMGFQVVGRRQFQVGAGVYDDLVFARPVDAPDLALAAHDR
jgi:diamine N-acetyltransferase